MIILFLTALGLAIGVARAYKYKSDKAVFYERLLLPVIFFTVGINGILFGFIPHVFFSDMIADQMGWPKGSPFQLEVGYHDGEPLGQPLARMEITVSHGNCRDERPVECVEF